MIRDFHDKVEEMKRNINFSSLPVQMSYLDDCEEMLWACIMIEGELDSPVLGEVIMALQELITFIQNYFFIQCNHV